MFWSECVHCGCPIISRTREDHSCRGCRWIMDILYHAQIEDSIERIRQRLFEPAPLNADEQAAVNSLPADFIPRLLRGERPLTDPTTFAN